jgi:hypothetical protein
MNHEAIENIKAELDHLDPAALQSIREIINQSKRNLAPSLKNAVDQAWNSAEPETANSKSLQFVDENLTLEEYERLSITERRALKRRLKEQNYNWLQKKFSELNAAWLIVVDGEVIAFGKSLKDQPMQPQIREICQRTGKFPFVFINDAFMIIEESATAWHETNKLADSYPTLPVTLSSASGNIDIIGDFDTGSARTFTDYDFLVIKNMIQPEMEDSYESSRHLNKSFDYVTKFLHCKLTSKSGKAYDVEAKIYCVFDWHLSPFVAINPNRVALIGRDLLLELKPKVLLDFERRQTEIVTSTNPRQARKKTNSGQKRTNPRSSRRR